VLKTKDFEAYEGLTVTLRQLPAMEASDVMYRLSRAFGPAFGAFAQALEGDDLDLSSLPGALQLLFQNLPASEFRDLQVLLLRDATFQLAESAEEKAAVGGLFAKYAAGGKLTNFDVLFAGRVAQVFPLLWEALALNFGFSEAALLNNVGDRAKAAMEKFLSKSKGNSKSAGTATASSTNE
jgi:hypothetical protein